MRGDDSKLSIATTVTLVLAVAALVLVKEPLKSSRPIGGGLEPNGTTDGLKVRAKPWQDPFAAVQRDLNAKRKEGRLFTGEGTIRLSREGATQQETTKAEVKVGAGGAARESGAASLKQDLHKRASDGATVTTLIVMTAGGPYVDGAESRIADRYAVEAALNVGCFAPESTDFLHYFTWRFESHEVVTPFEWYNRNKTADCAASHTYDHDVLIVWVKAEDYQDQGKSHVLKGLETLLDKITDQPLTVKLVGPRSSSELQGMLHEIERRQDAKLSEVLPRGGRAPSTGSFAWPTRDGDLELYSPWATAMPGLLAYELKKRSGATAVPCETYADCDEVFRDLLAAAGLHMLYAIDSDRVLFETLFQELDRRNVTVGEDRLVLIGEWDSLYARALPITFSAAACHYIADETIKKSRPPSEEVIARLRGKCGTTEEGVNALIKGDVLPEDLNVTRYSYLSGLDGESLEDQQRRPKSTGGQGDEEKGKGKTSLRDVAELEKPEGTSQFDYVRRLVSRIKSEEQDAVRQHRRKVQAIGILGRDSYDALLILQAMREQFPTVLFFAHDLYARYFHASERAWTRNLLVVSHFGLQLDPRLQQSIPPFRNSYQTSTFLALLRSIGQVDQRPCLHERAMCYVWTGGPKEDEYTGRISPRIFEIGRDGAVDLSVTDLPLNVATVHPPRPDVEPHGRTVRLPEGIGMFGIAMLLVAAVAVLSYGRLWRWLTAAEMTEGRVRSLAVRGAFVAGPVLVLLLLWNGVQAFPYDSDEPFSWSDGVSIWPTELIRVVAGLLCLWFLLKGRADLANNTRELTRRFFPHTEGHELPRPRFWRDLEWMFHGSPPGPTPSAADLWQRYCAAHRGSQRVGRVLLLFVLYYALISSIWPLLNDGAWRLFVPCRGTVSCRADFFAVLFSVVPLVVLNLSVLDAVLLCARWVSELSGSSGLSPVSTIRLIGERTRVVNRRVLYAFIALALVMAARSHYFDNWDFPPVLIVVLTAHSLVALASASTLYLVSASARARVLSSIQEQLDRSMHWDAEAPRAAEVKASAERLRTMISEIESIHQGAFLPFYQQPAVQASLVVALAFLQYWYLGQ